MGWWASSKSWLLGADDSAHLQARAETPPPSDPSTARIAPARTDLSTASALSLPSVYRAVSILATGVSQLTVDVWRGDEPSPRVPAWVRRPDIKVSRSAFFEQTTVGLAVTGNAFWRVHRDSAADPVQALTVLNPHDVVINEDGTYGYQNQRPLQDWQVQHLALLRVPGARYGLGPIQAARADLAGVLDLRDYAAEWFNTAGVPNGVLSTEQVLAPDQAAQYKKQWMEQQSHKNGPAVLGAGIAYSPIMLSPKDAQFLESRRYTVTEIARLFGIPASLMLATVDGAAMTYQNVADADLSFARWTLVQYLREIEEAISTLLPRGTEARFNLDAVLRPSTKARYDAHKIAIEAGFLTVDEVRAIEGLKPLPMREPHR
ncbi:phage portal protein [Georgenia yuyongxinii]|uniref:Phage portal protein n=1 Tax=Georgenia yuyongxinii TaxID=2589797 RepID=A0A5B8C3Y7_9MICO|nr:phage portal protein [Georgenia yuyongxinii]QDC24790.1 phage portal protein [Georgenia yuyongxinii]